MAHSTLCKRATPPLMKGQVVGLPISLEARMWCLLQIPDHLPASRASRRLCSCSGLRCRWQQSAVLSGACRSCVCDQVQFEAGYPVNFAQC
jgi:hypothetical protein